MNNNIMVSVVMITYNHENYIRQAIDGVLMQKTNFPVELIIANDHSPDNTDTLVKQIIDNYNGNIKIRYYNHAKNLGVSKNFKWALQQAQGKYIAICEGDDYWTDPYKLQKQVDFLEENEEYGLVATQRTNFNQTTGKFQYSIPFNVKYKSFNFFDVLIGVEIATLTVLVKKELMDKLLFFSKENSIVGYDYTIWLFISYYKKIAILNDTTAVYRILSYSLSHQKNKWQLKKTYFHDFFLIMKYFNLCEDPNVKKAMYYRAKSFYLIASKDLKASKKIKKILAENNDYFRLIILKIVQTFPKLNSVFLLLDKFILKLKQL